MREPVYVESVIEALGSTQAESELMDANKTVKDLRLKIEQSNSRANAQNEYLEIVEMDRRSSTDWEMMRELEDVKHDLNSLKLDIASLLEEKRTAEKETEVFKSKARSCSSSAETLEKEIDGIEEEQVLAELARIEALKELAIVESQRKQDYEKHIMEMDERKKRINLMSQELDSAKVFETELSVTLADVYMMENELKQIRQIKTPESVREQDNPDSMAKEIETAKNELANVKDEGFRIMASIDMSRTELKNVSEEVARVKKREEKIELSIQNMNAKLIRGRSKLKAASLSEETANSTVSNLSNTLEQYKTETIAAKKEVLLIKEEIQKIKEEIKKTESLSDETESKLQTALEELKSIKSSEAKALEKLQALTENTLRNRASVLKNSSVLTISKFEYQYLKDQAARAEEIADKKVAAAQAWIEALKASEREILMETEKVKKEMLEGHETPRLHSKKGACENEMDIWMQTHDKKTVEVSRGSSNTSGKPTPIRRGKQRLSISNGVSGTTSRSSVSLSSRRRIKVMPNLAKIFTAKTENRKA